MSQKTKVSFLNEIQNEIFQLREHISHLNDLVTKEHTDIISKKNKVSVPAAPLLHLNMPKIAKKENDKSSFNIKTFINHYMQFTNKYNLNSIYIINPKFIKKSNFQEFNFTDLSVLVELKTADSFNVPENIYLITNSGEIYKAPFSYFKSLPIIDLGIKPVFKEVRIRFHSGSLKNAIASYINNGTNFATLVKQRPLEASGINSFFKITKLLEQPIEIQMNIIRNKYKLSYSKFSKVQRCYSLYLNRSRSEITEDRVFSSGDQLMHKVIITAFYHANLFSPNNLFNEKDWNFENVDFSKFELKDLHKYLVKDKKKCPVKIKK